MEAARAEGIVLRKQPVTESSLVVTWFTREAGKLKTMAKGARRVKGPLVGKIDLFYQDEILYLPSRRGELHLLTDCFLVNPYRRLRGSVAGLTAAAYACELVESITELEDAQPGIFEALAGVLEALGREDKRPALLIWFELRLLALAGWEPRWETRAGVDRMLKSLTGSTLAAAQRVKLNAAQVREARELVWRFWDGEVGRTPKSRLALEQVAFL